MNGLSYFYNALNNRQARIERDEREAQRILEQERQRKQRAAANKHAGMMNTLNLLGTVGGAIAGAPGGPGAAMAGASLGSALASGITGIAPNVMGTQPSADNPYYDAPSDSQRALSAINAGLQVASTYETNLKKKYLANETQRVALKSREYIRNGDYDSALNLTTPGEDGGLAPIWGELGIKEGELPWYVNANELNSIAAAESVRLSDQIFPAIESRKLDSQFQSVDLVRTAGSAAGALELIGPVLSARGDKAKINEYLGTLSPEQRASIEGIASQPFFIQKEVASHIYKQQGKNEEALAKAQKEIAQQATKSFNAKVDKNINTVGKMYNQVVYGGTDFDLRQSAAIKDRLTELGIFTNQELTPEEFLIVHQMTVGFSPEQMASAAAKNFDNQDRVQQAFENLAQATGDSRFAEVGAMYQQKLQAGTVGVPSQYASVLGVGSGNVASSVKSQPVQTAVNASVDSNTSETSTSAEIVEPEQPPLEGYSFQTRNDPNLGGLNNEMYIQRTTTPTGPRGRSVPFQPLLPEGTDGKQEVPRERASKRSPVSSGERIENKGYITPQEQQASVANPGVFNEKAREELTDQNVLAQAQGEKPTRLNQIYETGVGFPIATSDLNVPRPATVGFPLDASVEPVREMSPIDVGMSEALRKQALQRRTPADTVATAQSLARAEQDGSPAGEAQAVEQVGETKEGQKIWVDQYGREFSELTITIPMQEANAEDILYINIPTVVNETGQILKDDEAAAMVNFRDPRDFNTGLRLPVFETEEDAIRGAIRRSEYLGREDYKGPVNPKKATAEDYMGQVIPDRSEGNLPSRKRVGYVQQDDFVATSDRQGRRQRAEDAKAAGPLPATIGVDQAPTTNYQIGDRLVPEAPKDYTREYPSNERALLEYARETGMDQDTLRKRLYSIRQDTVAAPASVTTAREANANIDRDIANAQIQRAAGPDMQRLEAEQENKDREQAEEFERGFEVYLRNRRKQMAQQAREQEGIRAGFTAPLEATPIVDQRLTRPPVSPAQDDRSDRGTPVRVPSYLKNTTFDELSQDEYDKLPPNQKATYSPNRVALPLDAVEERKEPPAASKPQAMLEKALKTEGLEGMTPVIRDMIQLESSGNPEARNQMGSNAFGLLQLTDDTFERYAPKGAKRGDQKAEIAAAVALLKDNKTYLEKNEVTPNFVNLYIVHHFGKGGLSLLKADPDDLITEVTYQNSNTGKLTRLIDADKIAQNPWLNSSMTVSEMLEKVRDARERGQFGSTGGAA